MVEIFELDRCRFNSGGIEIKEDRVKQLKPSIFREVERNLEKEEKENDRC